MLAALAVAGLLAALPEGPPRSSGSASGPAAGGTGGVEPAFDDAWLDEALGAWPAEGAPAAAPRGPLSPDGGWLHRALALPIDALPSALALRRPIPARPPLAGTLDALQAASKAAAVLEMFQAYAGADRWRAALDAHRVARGALGADADVLVEALGEVAGADVAAALRGFLERPGVALLRSSVRCAAGAAKVVLRVEPLPGGRPGQAARAGLAGGAIPVCVRAGGDRGVVTACALASPPLAEVPLPFCPAWAWPNAGGVGYYLTWPAPGQAERLLPRLDAGERLALAVDAAVLARQGALSPGEALGLVGPLARDPDPRLVEASLLLAGLVEPGWLDGPQRRRWQAWLRRSYGAAARALGWLPRAGEGEAAGVLRPLLLPLLAGEGADAVLAGEALALARRWLAEPRQVPGAVAWPALGAAAVHGDLELLERVLAAARQAPDAEARGRLWAVAGRFRAPEVAAAALAQAQAEGAPADEAALLGAALEGPDTRDAAWRAVRQRWDELAPRLEPPAAAALAEAAGLAACEPRRRAEVAAFLGPRVAAQGGVARALELALERADLCLAGRARRAEAVGRLLGR